MSEFQFVEAALSSLKSVIRAVMELDEVDSAAPNDLVVDFQGSWAEVFQAVKAKARATKAGALFRAVKDRAEECACFAGTRLDDLAVRHLRSDPGEWGIGLLNALRDFHRLAKPNNDYEDELRRRLNELGTLALLLRNDATASTNDMPPGQRSPAAGAQPKETSEADQAETGPAFRSAAQGKPKDEQSEADEPPLSPLQLDLLEALRTCRATDQAKRATGSQLGVKVGGDATEQSVKAPLADLKRRGLVDSRTGRKGGTWLTPAGSECINSLRPK